MPGTIKYKIFDSDIKAFDEKDLTVEHFISTERRDRGDDVMIADGMQIKGKPVVLLQHGRTALGSEPVAKPVWIKKGTYKNKKGIVAKTKFFDDEQGLGRRLWEKTTKGYMPNWSIGYQILDWTQKRDFMEIKEWDLLEYSLVGVPMNPDAQTIYSKEYDDLETVFEDIEENIKEGEKAEDFPSFRFIVIPEVDEQEKDTGEKPYENEHACRIVKKDWDSVRRNNNKFGDGIHAIFGIKNDTAELASIRFDSSKHTADKAHKWCKDHDYKCDPFEPAKNKEKEEEKSQEKPDFVSLSEESKTALINKLSESISKKIDEKLEEIFKKKGLDNPPIGEPASKDKENDKDHEDNPRMRLVIKQNDQELIKNENTRLLAGIIADAVGKSFKQGIKKLLGKVD